MDKKERYIQVGVTALRAPGTHEFLPAVPLYIRAEDAAPGETERLTEDIGKIFAEKMRGYVDACKAAGVAI